MKSPALFLSTYVCCTGFLASSSFFFSSFLLVLLFLLQLFFFLFLHLLFCSFILACGQNIWFQPQPFELTVTFVIQHVGHQRMKDYNCWNRCTVFACEPSFVPSTGWRVPFLSPFLTEWMFVRRAYFGQFDELQFVFYLKFYFAEHWFGQFNELCFVLAYNEMQGSTPTCAGRRAAVSMIQKVG